MNYNNINNIKNNTLDNDIYNNQKYNIRLLDIEEIKEIYNEHIVTDFPASEVKPLKQMLEKRENDQYFVYGMYENREDSCGRKYDELAGYAYFIKCRNQDVYLLDYLAIVKDKRSKHLGSGFLQQLKKLAKDDGKLLILEVENPDYADEGPARDYMLKRIGFEMCCGGIIGMGENREDVVDMLMDVKEINPESVPINFLLPIKGTRLADRDISGLTPQYCLKVLCLARLLVPKSDIRCAAGREVYFKGIEPTLFKVVDSIFASGYLTADGQGIDDTIKMIENAGFTGEIESKDC